MKPPRLSYVRPGTVEEALEQVSRDAMPLAGGQSLLPLLNLRRARPRELVDLGAIDELHGTYFGDDGELVIGAMTTMATIERDSNLRDAVPLLARALPFVGNPQIRASGTIGGSVAHRDPVGEVLTALVALQATATVRSLRGARRAPVLSLLLAEGELLVDVRIPRALLGRPGSFHEVAPRYAARALAVAAAVADCTDAGTLRSAHVVVGGLASTPAELKGLEPLYGQTLDARVDELVRAAVRQVPAIGDPRADERYRREATAALAARALREAGVPEAQAVSCRGAFLGRGANRPQPRRRLDGAEVLRMAINRDELGVSVEPRLLLSDLLRSLPGLQATHVGCEHGVCGACNIVLDGEVVRSCLTLAVQAEGRDVQTLEGIRSTGALDELIDAFVEGHGLQCGFCTPGFLMTIAQLRSQAAPITARDLVGNICRCTGYGPILAVAGGEPSTVADPRSIPRIGARRLAAGRGRYTDDIADDHALHAAFVRSPVPHALIHAVRLDAVRAAPGVRAAYSAADLRVMGARPMPVGWTLPGQRPTATGLLAEGRVRYVGEAIAVVLADTRYLAEDACELVQLELEELPYVLDVESALAADSPRLYPGWDDNLLVRQVVAGGDVEAAFREADVIVGDRFEISRQTGVPMEPRASLARYDPLLDEVTIFSSAQSPHHSAEHLAAALGRAQRSVRVITPDVGGSFGVKDHACTEEAVVALAAIELERPVRWTQDRWENLVAGVHSRGQLYDVELAGDRDGRILGVRGRLLYDVGARSGNHSAGTAVYSSLVMPGPYDFRSYRLELLALVTNAPPSGAYRGYGAPEAAFAMEGLIDALARELSLDAVEVRRRNLLAPDQYPYVTASGLTYDAGDPRRALARAVELAEGAPGPRAGSVRGVGFATFVLMSGFGPTRAALDAGMSFGGYETARVRMDRQGFATVSIGMPTQGQGIETALAQTAAAALGIDPRAGVRLESSDTARVPYSPVGAIASRGAAVGCAAVDQAAALVADQLRRMAATMLDVPVDAMELRDGDATAPDGRTVPIELLAEAIQRGELELGEGETMLEASATVDPATETFSYGAHVAVVDVDPETGVVHVVRYAAVSDCGRLINPAIVAGQIEGGVVQGIGGALMEEVAFAADGTPRSATLFDYTLPTAADIPTLAIEMIETPTTLSRIGARGAGELGIIGPGAAIAGAVTAALGGTAPARRLPLTQPRVRALARTATGRES